MRDDDETDDAPLGKLFQLGVSADSIRADYGLAPGQRALHDGALEFVSEPHESEVDESRELSRRRFFVMAAGATALSAGALAFGVLLGGDKSSNVADDPKSPLIPRAAPNRLREVAAGMLPAERARARARIHELAAEYGVFLFVVRNCPNPGPDLWYGVERLGKFALVEGGEQGYRIARRLMSTFDRVTPPSRLSPLIQQLQDLLWERRKGKR